MSLYGSAAQGRCGSCGSPGSHNAGRCPTCGGPWSPRGGIGDDRSERRDYLPPTFSFEASESNLVWRAATNGVVAKVVIESNNRQTVIDLAWRCAEEWA